VKKPAPAQHILAEQGYIILAADVSYPLGSMIPLADCGPDYERTHSWTDGPDRRGNC